MKAKGVQSVSLRHVYESSNSMQQVSVHLSANRVLVLSYGQARNDWLDIDDDFTYYILDKKL